MSNNSCTYLNPNWNKNAFIGTSNLSNIREKDKELQTNNFFTELTSSIDQIINNQLIQINESPQFTKQLVEFVNIAKRDIDLELINKKEDKDFVENKKKYLEQMLSLNLNVSFLFKKYYYYLVL